MKSRLLVVAVFLLVSTPTSAGPKDDIIALQDQTKAQQKEIDALEDQIRMMRTDIEKFRKELAAAKPAPAGH